MTASGDCMCIWILATVKTFHVHIVNIYVHISIWFGLSKFVTLWVRFVVPLAHFSKGDHELLSENGCLVRGFLVFRTISSTCAPHTSTRLYLKMIFRLFLATEFLPAHNHVHFPHTFHLRLYRSRWANRPYIYPHPYICISKFFAPLALVSSRYLALAWP